MTNSITPQPPQPPLPWFCKNCGGEGPFRSSKAIRCVECDKVAAENRREFAKAYHAARSRAVSRLVKDYHLRFKEYLDQERQAQR